MRGIALRQSARHKRGRGGSARPPVVDAGDAGTTTTANSGTEHNSPAASARPPPLAGYTRPKHYAWADLLQRTFAIDVLACPDCGGRLRLLATIDDPNVIEKILRHLGLPIDPPTPTPARVSGYLPGFETSGDWVTG